MKDATATGPFMALVWQNEERSFHVSGVRGTEYVVYNNSDLKIKRRIYTMTGFSNYIAPKRKIPLSNIILRSKNHDYRCTFYNRASFPSERRDGTRSEVDIRVQRSGPRRSGDTVCDPDLVSPNIDTVGILTLQDLQSKGDCNGDAIQ
jgi:hypothetical protein